MAGRIKMLMFGLAKREPWGRCKSFRPYPAWLINEWNEDPLRLPSGLAFRHTAHKNLRNPTATAWAVLCWIRGSTQLLTRLGFLFWLPCGLTLTGGQGNPPVNHMASHPSKSCAWGSQAPENQLAGTWEPQHKWVLPDLCPVL